MKKILIIISYVILIGGAAFGILHFKNLNDKQVAANEELNRNMASVQSELDAIGALVTVYETYTEVEGTHKFTMEDLKEVSIPQSALGEATITDVSKIIGMAAKVDIKPGSILSEDMLMDANSELLKYSVDVTMPYLPIHLDVGEYIDVYAMLANGESIPVLTHKEVFGIMDLTVQLKLSQEELYCWNALLYDYALFANYGFSFYPTRYVNPGIDNTVAFYPVQADNENMVRFDINVSDPTRCINETLRGHIDLVNSIATTDTNAAMSSQISTLFADQATLLQELRQQRIEEEAEAEENDYLTVTTDPVVDEYSESLDQTMGDAIDDINNGVQDLNIIE